MAFTKKTTKKKAPFPAYPPKPLITPVKPGIQKIDYTKKKFTKTVK